jgi:hypothetical protein
LLKRARDDERVRDLFAEAMEAAARTRVAAKRRAFGLALARGYLLTDDASIDEERFIVRTLDELEMPHLHALTLVATNPEAYVRELLSTFGDQAEPIENLLSRNGLLKQYDAYGGQFFQGPSAYGLRVWTYVLESLDG